MPDISSLMPMHQDPLLVWVLTSPRMLINMGMPQGALRIWIYIYHGAPRIFIKEVFSCDQAALRMAISVSLSVCLSVFPSVTPFSQCSSHRIIMKFSGVITNDKSDVHAKGQGQRSKVKVTEVMTTFSRFRTVTPVWIHIWWWNDA